MQWLSISINENLKLLRLEFKSAEAQVAEIVLYGTALATNISNLPAPLLHTPTTMGQLIGTNAFIDDPKNMIANTTGTLREYHSWQWDEGNQDASYPGYPNNQYAWNRSTGFPADVLNFHHYSNEGDGQDGKATRGISPESDRLKQKLQRIVA